MAREYPLAHMLPAWDKKWRRICRVYAWRRFRFCEPDADGCFNAVLERAARFDDAQLFSEPGIEPRLFIGMMKFACLGVLKRRRAKMRDCRVVREICFADALPSRPEDLEAHELVKQMTHKLTPFWRRIIEAMEATIADDGYEHGDFSEAVADRAGVTPQTLKVQRSLMRRTLAGGLEGLRGMDGKPFGAAYAARGETAMARHTLNRRRMTLHVPRSSSSTSAIAI